MGRIEARTRNEGFVRPAQEGVFLRLRVSPGAKRTLVKGLYGEDALRLSVAAPPVDGKANTEVERFLADLLGVPNRAVGMVSGVSSRDKTVLARGVELEEIQARLRLLL